MCNVNNLIIPIITLDIAPREPSARRGIRSNRAGSGISHENKSSFALKSILEKDKLNNTNFLEWDRNLKIVLKFAKKHYVLEGPVPNEPKGNTTTACKAWDKHNEDAIEVDCLMQATMSSDLQKNMEDMIAFDMIQQLTGMFQKQARQERYDTMKQLIGRRMQEGSSVSAHVLTMKGYIKKTE
ncbi:hypothetical protein E3N88_00335 [Mikania micrantha]|uniref:Retrotransposon Copia-like N-terminal domain-containing protein n=1 Tax=Mikania micrantha TaxID=192012 RepID=A0A5N6PXT6_9ASTR|nr:hypothetical protein E3N88_00335 [Mikania micrantha]